MKKITIELLIVFVGVYGAFLLNSYRQQNQWDQVQLKYYETFPESLENSCGQTKRLKEFVDTTLTQVQQSEGSAIPYNRNLLKA